MTNSSYEPIEILLVEDNPNDAEITLRALKRANFANNVQWLKDGEEALAFLFSEGQFSDRCGCLRHKCLDPLCSNRDTGRRRRTPPRHPSP